MIAVETTPEVPELDFQTLHTFQECGVPAAQLQPNCRRGTILNPRGEVYARFSWLPDQKNPFVYNLSIDKGRKSTDYFVQEFPSEWDGRAWHFTKKTTGSDKTETAYDVFCGHNRQDSRCTCKGFESSHWCKHLGFCLELLDREQEWDREEIEAAVVLPDGEPLPF